MAPKKLAKKKHKAAPKKAAKRATPKKAAAKRAAPKQAKSGGGEDVIYTDVRREMRSRLLGRLLSS